MIRGEEIELFHEKLNTGEAAGRDGIFPELIEYGGPQLTKVLQSLF